MPRDIVKDNSTGRIGEIKKGGRNIGIWVTFDGGLSIEKLPPKHVNLICRRKDRVDKKCIERTL